jgi:hypothetical protein
MKAIVEMTNLGLGDPKVEAVDEKENLAQSRK